ncbi:MAG: cyclic pyranopterin monophosphate synthase MoaC [Treponema sp.]|nr:cyclic pyranopterin monophosphate synthase MoaC [Treponema sp.]
MVDVSAIPLCHSLVFDSCAVDFTLGEDKIEAVCTVKLSGKTGAEMEALTGVSAALLTIYDMCKALDRAMVISDIRSAPGGISGSPGRRRPLSFKRGERKP